MSQFFFSLPAYTQYAQGTFPLYSLHVSFLHFLTKLFNLSHAFTHSPSKVTPQPIPVNKQHCFVVALSLHKEGGMPSLSGHWLKPLLRLHKALYSLLLNYAPPCVCALQANRDGSSSTVVLACFCGLLLDLYDMSSWPSAPTADSENVAVPSISRLMIPRKSYLCLALWW